MVGSVLVIINAAKRLINPVEINYNGMIIFAVIGAVTNFAAAYFTREGDSLNQKAVNLHMLEDVLGWVVVLIGAVAMKFTDISVIDPLMSIGVALFILINTVKNLKEVVELFLEKTPHGISIDEIKKHITEIDGVEDVHHIHLWSLDGVLNYATMHVVTNGNAAEIKQKIREELAEHNIVHATLELESPDEACTEHNCHVEHDSSASHHHHHHH